MDEDGSDGPGFAGSGCSPGRVIRFDATMASDSQVSVLLRSGSMCSCSESCRELQRYLLAIRGHVPLPVVEVSRLGVRFV